ncbi:MAG TPA: transposase [Gemmatimonadales bacterium]|jgi:REP element-mobilizing transposase RayT|nr:transposase [Gemmatimonadales bacterium]
MTRQELRIYRRHLPHWRLPYATYHVTWSLQRHQADLSAPERSLVVSAMKCFEADRYDLYAYCVMNDHAHGLVAPKPEFDLEDIVRSWKSYSTNRMQRNFGRKGAVWLEEYFDRIVRSRLDYETKVKYILENPLKRWPGIVSYRWCGLGRAGTKEIGFVS